MGGTRSLSAVAAAAAAAAVVAVAVAGAAPAAAAAHATGLRVGGKAAPPAPASCCALGGTGDYTATLAAAVNSYDNLLAGWVGADATAGVVTEFFGGVGTPATSSYGLIITTNATGAFMTMWGNGTCHVGESMSNPIPTSMCFGAPGTLFPTLLYTSTISPALTLATYVEGPETNGAARITVTADASCAPIYIYSRSPFANDADGTMLFGVKDATATPPPASWFTPPTWCA